MNKCKLCGEKLNWEINIRKAQKITNTDCDRIYFADCSCSKHVYHSYYGKYSTITNEKIRTAKYRKLKNIFSAVGILSLIALPRTNIESYFEVCLLYFLTFISLLSVIIYTYYIEKRIEKLEKTEQDIEKIKSDAKLRLHKEIALRQSAERKLKCLDTINNDLDQQSDQQSEI